VVDELKWYSNQIVDHLAKEAAEGVRISGHVRGRLLSREKQLREYLIYLGKLTFEVNNFQTSEGIIRDSDAKKCSRVKKRSKKQDTTKMGSTARKRTCSVTFKRFVGRSCRGGQDQLRTTQSAKQRWMGRARLASLEASFFKSWREERASSVKPSVGPSATARMDALKARVVAKSATRP